MYYEIWFLHVRLVNEFENGNKLFYYFWERNTKYLKFEHNNYFFKQPHINITVSWLQPWVKIHNIISTKKFFQLFFVIQKYFVKFEQFFCSKGLKRDNYLYNILCFSNMKWYIPFSYIIKVAI